VQQSASFKNYRKMLEVVISDLRELIAIICDTPDVNTSNEN